MYIQIKTGQSSLLLSERLFALTILPLLFLLITGMFFKFSIMSPLWAVVYLLSFIWFGLTVPRTLQQIWQWKAVFVLPAIALLSVVWSTQPTSSLTAAIQLSVSTLLAVRIANTLDTRAIMLALLFATSTGVVLSLASPNISQLWPIYEPNGAFIGVYIQKTVAGVAFALCAVALVSTGAALGRIIVPLLLAFALVPLILSASSVSALVVFGFVPLIVGLHLIHRTSPTTKFCLILGLLLFIGMIMTVLWLDEFDLSTEVLLAAGKNPTLTGRTDIWATGYDVWLQYPFTGVGFAAFWDNPMFAEVVGFIHATVDPRLKGFHNVFVEALVSTGIIGALAVAVIYLWTLVRCFLWYIATGSADALFWLALVTISLVFSMTDNALFSEHEQFHIYCVMAYVFAGSRPGIRMLGVR